MPLILMENEFAKIPDVSSALGGQHRDTKKILPLILMLYEFAKIFAVSNPPKESDACHSSSLAAFGVIGPMERQFRFAPQNDGVRLLADKPIQPARLRHSGGHRDTNFL